MFFFKKLVSPFLLPVTVLLILQLTGFFLLYFTRNQKLGRIFIAVATLLFVLLTYSFIPDLMLSYLEDQYPALVSAQSYATAEAPSVNWIVVLGGGCGRAPEHPALSQLNEASLGRLVEGIRIYRQLPGSRMIVSGGPVFGPPSDAEIMAKAAMEMGVPVEDIVQEHESRDTEEQAVFIARLLGSERFILVTSAYHMPRSMALFRKQGMNPIPAPANYQSLTYVPGPLDWLFPNTRGFEKASAATHEYLGIAWAKLRGRL